VLIFLAVVLGGVFALVLVGLVSKVKVGKTVADKKKRDKEAGLLENGKDETEERVAEI